MLKNEKSVYFFFIAEEETGKDRIKFPELLATVEIDQTAQLDNSHCKSNATNLSKNTLKNNYTLVVKISY